MINEECIYFSLLIKKATPWCLSPRLWPLWLPSFWQRCTLMLGSQRGFLMWCRAARILAGYSADTQMSPRFLSLGVCPQGRRWEDQNLRKSCQPSGCSIYYTSHAPDYGDGLWGSEASDSGARGQISSAHLWGCWFGECCERSSNGQFLVPRPGRRHVTAHHWYL